MAVKVFVIFRLCKVILEAELDTFGRPFWSKGHMFDTPAFLYTFDCTPQGGDVN